MPRLLINYARLSTFEHCRKKYWFKFVEGIRPPWRVTPAGIIGRGVHDSLGRFVLSGDETVGRTSLDAYLRMPDHSMAGPATPYYEFAMTLYERGVTASRSFQSLDTWSEQNLAAFWAKADLGFDAILDRIDDLGGGQWQIIDWKTGNYESGETTDLQLDIAHVVLRATKRLPHDAVVTTIGWNLRHETRRVRILNQTHAAATMRMLLARARKINTTTDFSASPSRMCGFCDFRDRCDEAQFAALGRLDWADEVLSDESGADDSWT